MQNPILITTMPLDSAVVKNTVVVASGSNAGNGKLPAAAGATDIMGVTNEDASSNNSTYYGAVMRQGIAACRALTGTAIAVGDKVKVADTAGRVTKLTPVAGSGVGTATRKGVVGIAQSVIASGDASDTIVYVLLTPGGYDFE